MRRSTRDAQPFVEGRVICSDRGNFSCSPSLQQGRNYETLGRHFMAKKALITGITGQDGSYLTELLLAKGYEVHGIIRRTAAPYAGQLERVYAEPNFNSERLSLHHGDLSDAGSLKRLLDKIQPEEVYNLAAQSDVRISFDIPGYTADITATGVARLLEAIHESGLRPRFYQASSSEMFGKVRTMPQNESTPFHPRSPYACAKVYAYWITVNYRESYGLHASNGILFNHESPRRGENFVTRKITRPLRASRPGFRTNCSWAIWRPGATGVTRRNTSKPCG